MIIFCGFCDRDVVPSGTVCPDCDADLSSHACECGVWGVDECEECGDSICEECTVVNKEPCVVALGMTLKFRNVCYCKECCLPWPPES